MYVSNPMYVSNTIARVCFLGFVISSDTNKATESYDTKQLVVLITKTDTHCHISSNLMTGNSKLLLHINSSLYQIWTEQFVTCPPQGGGLGIAN